MTPTSNLKLQDINNQSITDTIKSYIISTGSTSDITWTHVVVIYCTACICYQEGTRERSGGEDVGCNKNLSYRPGSVCHFAFVKALLIDPIHLSIASGLAYVVPSTFWCTTLHKACSLQQEDLLMFGQVVFALCCNVAASNPQRLQMSLETIGRIYSLNIRNVALFLIGHTRQRVCDIYMAVVNGWSMVSFFLFLW